MEIVERLLAGDRRAAAYLISLVEDGGSQAREVVAALYPYTGRAYIVGVTGSPGTGKSTLVFELSKVMRLQGKRIGIIAVDPTSPLSGGAILGDRIRMQELSTDGGVFIRSMATRGSLGGLARAAGDVVKVLDAMGQDIIFVETAGAGQSEVEIACMAHTVVVVVAPGLGDEIQAIKAGLFEIAHIFVVNKADREGTETAASALEYMLEMERESPSGWKSPVLKTVATSGQGVEAVAQALGGHFCFLKESGRWEMEKRQSVEKEVKGILGQELLRRTLSRLQEGKWEGLIAQVAERQMDPYTAVEKLLADDPGQKG